MTTGDRVYFGLTPDQPSARQIAAAAESSYTIDPTNGPLRTWNDYRALVGKVEVNVAQTINITEDLGASEVIYPPRIGPTGAVTIRGTGLTTLRSGTLTAGTVSFDYATRRSAKVTDSTITADWDTAGTGGTDLKNKRIKNITQDDYAWLQFTNAGAKTAWTSQTAAPWVATDSYLVQELPLVAGIAFDQPIAPGGTLVFEDLAITKGTVPQLYGPATFNQNCVTFNRCDCGSITGVFTANYSLHKWLIIPANSAIVVAQGSIVDDGTQVGFAFYGSYLSLGTTQLFETGMFLYNGTAFIDAAIFNGPAGINALDIQDCEVIIQSLTGSGSDGYGVNVQQGNVVPYVTKPNITATTNDARIAGTAFAWAAIPAMVSTATTFGGIVAAV